MDKLIDYSILATRFVEGMINNEKTNVEETILDCQHFIIDMIEDIVYELEPIEDYENAHLSLQIINALYIPIQMYKRNLSNEKAEQLVKKEIDELIADFREKRDEQNRKNNKNTKYS